MSAFPFPCYILPMHSGSSGGILHGLNQRYRLPHPYLRGRGEGERNRGREKQTETQRNTGTHMHAYMNTQAPTHRDRQTERYRETEKLTLKNKKKFLSEKSPASLGSHSNIQTGPSSFCIDNGPRISVVHSGKTPEQENQFGKLATIT